MDLNKLRALAGISSTQAKQPSQPTAPRAVPAGLFETASKAAIVGWLKDSHSSFSSAVGTLNHFTNRDGKNLSADRRGLLENAKIALREAFGDATELEPFDAEIVRRMAGIPSKVSENHPKPEDKAEDKGEEKPEDKAEEKPTAEDRGEAHDELIKTIAKSVEGKSFDEVKDLLGQVYDAGFHDGKADVEAPAEEEPEVSDEESANAEAEEAEADEAVQNKPDF